MDIVDIVPRDFIIALFTILIILIVFINTLVIFILASKKHMRTPQNLFIISLSSVDLIIGLIITSLALATLLNAPIPAVLCNITSYIEITTFSAGVLSLLAITIDRYMAVIKANTYKPTIKTTSIKILILWMVSFIYGLRYFAQIEIEKLLAADNQNFNTTSGSDDDDEIQSKGEFCAFFIENRTTDLYIRAFDILFLFIIPTFVMSILYYKIIKNLKRHSNQTSELLKKKKRVTKMLIICVTVFIVCWLPYSLQDIILDSMELVSGEENEYVELVVRLISVVLALSNSFLNPIVYGCLNKRFKLELLLMKENFHAKCKRRNRIEDATSTQES